MIEADTQSVGNAKKSNLQYRAQESEQLEASLSDTNHNSNYTDITIPCNIGLYYIDCSRFLRGKKTYK